MKIVAISIFCILSLTLSAQTNSNTVEPDQRLIEAYGTEYIDQLSTANPFLIQRWNFYLGHAYDVIDDAGSKTTDYPTVQIADLEQINILLLEKQQGLTHDFNHPTVYRIANTTKLLVYKPGKEFNKLFKASLKE